MAYRDMEDAYQDPDLMYQQSSYDNGFFLQPNNNNNDDNASQLDMTAYRGAWPAHGGGTQNFPYANSSSSTRSPFVDIAYLDSFEPTVMPPVSCIAPSQTQLVPTPQLPTGPAETGMSFFELERQPPQPGITTHPAAAKKSGARPGGPETRFAPSSGNLRIGATARGKGPGLAPGTPASVRSFAAGARGRGPRSAQAAHVAVALDQGPSTETTRSEKKRGGQSDSSSDGEDSATIKTKQNHSVIERRYRDNLNAKINQLHRILQATEANSPLMRFDTQPPDPGRRVRKCEIMTKALQYVHRSELESRHMQDEVRRLRDQVSSLEKMIKCEDCTLLQNMRSMQFNKRPP
ncbi:bHLH/Zip transcription factor [Exophiala oligosperma]